jgi:hypothetical protein
VASPPLPSFAGLRFASHAAKPVHDDPVNWCGRCSRRFKGFGTLCNACLEIESRQKTGGAQSRRKISGTGSFSAADQSRAGRRP